MYCHKCGRELPDQAAFCPVCGAKILRGTPPHPEAVPSQAAGESCIPVSAAPAGGGDFIPFVNRYVQSATGFPTAAALLSSRVSTGFLWAVLLVPSVILALVSLVVSGRPGAALVFAILGLVIGFFAAYVAGWNARRKLSVKFSNTFEGPIDTEDLADFLSRNLSALSPMFHEWTSLTMDGLGLYGAISAGLINAVQQSLKEVTLGTELGEKRRYFAQLIVGPDLTDRTSGKLRYTPDVDHHLAGYMSFKKYTLLAQTAPVLHGAMEYYLAARKEGGGILSQTEDVSVPSPSTLQPSAHQAEGNAPSKGKKSRKPLVIAVLAVLLVVGGVFVAMNWSKADYIASVRAYQPFAASFDLPYTCGEVLEQYIDSAQWNDVEESKEVHTVEISGTAKGTEHSLLISIQVSPNPNDPNSFLFEPRLASIDGVETTTQNEVVEFLYSMFMAYDQGLEDLSILLEDEAVTLSQTFTDETAGISFQYPDGWESLETSGDYEIVRLIASGSNAAGRARFEVLVSLNTDPFGIFTRDEASVEQAVNEFHTFQSVESTTIGGVPAVELVYRTPGLQGDDIVINYWYANGDELYQIICSFSEASSMQYSYIFSAILDSYAVTQPAVSEPPAGTVGSLYYNGIALASFLGRPMEDLIDIFGDPIYGTPVDGSLYSGGEYYGYDGVSFIVDYATGMIAWVVGSPSMVEVNGVTLDKTINELTAVLGTPISEQPIEETEEIIGYSAQYLLSDSSLLMLEMADFNSPAYSFTLF